ncbi:XRE family transcriptional regulator [Streptomyces sp. NPDC047070]|uniref:XRE family transcriptional regulator n=1 Tax=Streptomyces sp. NPDC047070 TaxID=3154923 RepID=UPI003456D44D
MTAADAYTRLAETLERLAHALGRPKRLADVLDLGDLSRRTGESERIVRTLLEGGRVETTVAVRVRQRLEFLRGTRRRADGNRYSQQDLGTIVKVSRQTMSEWLKTGVISLEGMDLLREHFDLPAGFLTAPEPEALDQALQDVLRDLEAASDPLAALRTPAFYRLARRAPDMDPEKLKALEQWAVMIAQNETSS